MNCIDDKKQKIKVEELQSFQKDNSKKNKKLYTQKIFGDWCKACGICSAFCPKSVFGRDENGSPVIERSDDCIGCRFCELHCPDFAITISEREANCNKSSS